MVRALADNSLLEHAPVLLVGLECPLSTQS